MGADEPNIMSVLGIDLGNENSVIMIARKRGLDLAVNQSSNRKTPTMVGFAGPGEARNMGERAKMSMMGNIPTTVRNGWGKSRWSLKGSSSLSSQEFLIF